MERRGLRRAIGVVVLLFTGCGAAGAAPAVAGAPAPATIEELRARIQEVLDDEQVPGAGIAIVQRGEIVYAGGVGKADVARGIDVTAQTRFRVASITKSLVGLAMVKLRDDGKLSLDARLVDLAPEITVANPWESTHPVRVAHLLEHTAGFDDMHLDELVSSLGEDAPLRDVLAVDPTSRRPRWPPGTRMSYSNPGYTVAGYLIEKVAGCPYEDYIRDALLVPIGMKEATLRVTPDVQRSLAQGYDRGGHELPFLALLHRPAGNLVASPADMAQLVRFFVERGQVDGAQVVTAASVDRAERSETVGYDGHRALATQYGLGNYGEEVLGFVVHGHNGGVDGFSSVYAYDADREVGWVVLLNASGRPRARDRIGDLVAGFALRGLERPIGPRVDLPVTDLARVAGTYRLAGPRYQRFRSVIDLVAQRTITLDGGVLYARGVGGPRTALVPVSATLFRREDEPAPSLLLTQAEDGTPAMIDGHAYYERVSPWPRRLHLTALVGALAIALSSIVYALIWGTRFLVSRRFRSRGRFTARGLTALASLALCAVPVCIGSPTMVDLGTVSPTSLAIFAVSIAYPLLSLAATVAVVGSIAANRPMNCLAKAHTVAVAVAHLVLCGYLASWGLIAYRTWAS